MERISDFRLSDFGFSDFRIVNKDEEVNPCYGLETFTMSASDLNALLNGKKLYTTINAGEYAIEIYYRG